MPSTVIIADSILNALAGQAVREGVLRCDADHPLWKAERRRSRSTQDALSLVVLSDRLVIPMRRGSSLDIPPLSDAGILQISQYDFGSPAPGRADDPIAQGLEPYEAVRPFVLNKLMKTKKNESTGEDFDFLLASEAGVSRRTIYDAIIRYALAFYRGDMAAMERNMPWRVFPKKLRKELMDDPLRSRSLGPMTHRVMWIVTSAIFAVQQISSFFEISAKEKAGIASGDYGGTSRGWSDMSAAVTKARTAARGFFLLRCAIHQEGHYFPEVVDIRHALHLRRDPSLGAFRRQLNEFHECLKLGDRDALVELRKEVSKAKAALETSGRWSRQLRWVTYLTLPIAVAEATALGIPILSTCMSLYALGTTAAQHWAARKHGWVMFGS